MGGPIGDYGNAEEPSDEGHMTRRHRTDREGQLTRTGRKEEDKYARKAKRKALR